MDQRQSRLAMGVSNSGAVSGRLVCVGDVEGQGAA